MAEREEELESKIALVAEEILRSERIVAFTGAGVSTESGIPDFRSPGGIWTRFDPEDFTIQRFLSSEASRKKQWQVLMEGGLFGVVEPNPAHLALARLEAFGKLDCVITQNIDGLHQAAGIPDENVIELHGNTNYALCLECSKRFELEPIRQAFEKNPHAPACDICGGMVKTATISFGQSMPAAEMHAARKQSLACELFLSLGSSLVVYPAAGFPEMAKRNGARLVIINRDSTAMDDLADLVINESIGAVLAQAVGLE